MNFIKKDTDLDRRYIKKMDRYWLKMEKYFLRHVSEFDLTGWFDMHHMHTDWDGKGNHNLHNRENSIISAYKSLKVIEEFCIKYSKPIQSWIFIHEDSFEDAVYLHSNNANHTPFPYEFTDIRWDVTDNPILNKIINSKTHKIGKIDNQYGITYVVIKKPLSLR